MEWDVLHWILAISLTLLILDIFIITDVMSWVGLVLFALWGTWQLNLPIQWSIISFLIFLSAGITVYYTLWIKVVRPIFHKIVFRNSPESFQDSIIGQSGYVVENDEGAFYVKIADLIYPVSPQDYHILSDGMRVRVIKNENGFVRVSI